MTRRKRAHPDAGLREDVRQAIERAWPNDVIEMPSAFEESWFDDVEAHLGRDLRRVKGVGLFHEQSPEGLPPSMESKDEEYPAESEHSRSFHLFFLSPAGDEFAFAAETEDYVELDDCDEESMAEPEFLAETVAGHGRVGWAVAVSLVAPFALIRLSDMTTFDNRTVWEPGLDPHAETEDGMRIADPEAHFRKQAGEEAFAVLAQLRAKLAGILEKREIAVLPETEWCKPVPWLRGGEEVFVGASSEPVWVLDAFFFEGL